MPVILKYLAISGVLIVLLASGCAAMLYKGSRGERYSPLNHFVSELGELDVSRAARLFNAGLVLGGLLLLPFSIGLGISLGSWLAWMGTLAGIITAMALSVVGIFPMNNLEKHALAAMTFFRAGLTMVFFYGLAFAFQPTDRIVVPKAANILSGLAFLCYASFLLLTRPSREDENYEALDPDSERERPKVWALPVVEWLLFAATVLWVLGIAIAS